MLVVEMAPGEVAEQEYDDDRQENDGQAVLLATQETDVLRVVAVDVLDVGEAGATTFRRFFFGRIVSGRDRIC